MKDKKILNFGLLGKSLLVLTTLLACFSFGNLSAQTNCVKADFTVTVDNNSGTAKFEAKASSNAILYTWDFGSGTTVNGTTTSKKFSASGNYKVCLTVYAINTSTKQRCSTTVCKTVEIKKCDLQADFSIGKDGLVAKVEGKSNSKNAVYEFSFGDGKSDRGRALKHTYSKEGKYKICMNVKDTVTGCKAEVCKELDLRKCHLEVGFEFGTSGSGSKFKARSTDSNAYYVWDFGDGSDGKGSEVGHSYAKAGVYKVCVTAISKSSTVTQACTATVCKKVEIRKDTCDLKVDFEFSSNASGAKFKAKASNEHASFIWDFGDGSDGKGSEVGHSYAKAGVYKVCVTAIVQTASGDKRCTATNCKKVEIKGDKDSCTLKGNFSYSLDDKDIKVKGEANESGVIYYWSWGDGSADNGQYAKHSYAKEGVYEVCLIIFNPKTKCKYCVCKKVVVEKPCKLKGNFKYRIADNKVLFKARSNGSKDVEYTWDFGDGSDGKGSPIRHKYNKPGTYKVTLYVFDKRAGCKLEITKRLIINPRKTSMLDAEDASDATINSDVAAQVSVPLPDWNASAYPVPTQNVVNFSSDQKALTHATIYNSNGSKMMDVELQENNPQDIDITTLPTGFYFAHVTALDGSVKIVKFIKN